MPLTDLYLQPVPLADDVRNADVIRTASYSQEREDLRIFITDIGGPTITIGVADESPNLILRREEWAETYKVPFTIRTDLRPYSPLVLFRAEVCRPADRFLRLFLEITHDRVVVRDLM